MSGLPARAELAAREEAELRAYLGGSYDRARLERYEQQLEAELGEIGDEQRLYRTSEAYLYNLTALAMTHTKRPYLERLLRTVPPQARLLDYGCGIGSDGLLLLGAGYDVSFADFDNPSTRYLRWRLRRRGLKARIYDLDREQPPSGDFTLAYAFDVIEHAPNPFAFLAELERVADRVLVNFLEREPGETELHHELPVSALVARAASHELQFYRVHHRRSHLVLYRSRPPTGALARGRARVQLGRGRASALHARLLGVV